MKTIAVVGADGFVGSQICASISLNQKYKLVRVTRADDLRTSIFDVDIVIHAANPAGRFRAESSPQRDFEETVDKTFHILSHAKGKKIFLISSLSCRTQLNTSYGRNRRCCELLALSVGGGVIRLGPMFGGNRKQDIVHDLLAGRQIYVSPETRYAYVDVSWAGSKILELVNQTPAVYEIGAHNFVTLAELRDYFKSKSVFSGEDHTQIPDTTETGPDARLVIEYMRHELGCIDKWK
jgi:nucleoside-diphosphate-sugar epimerase